MHLTTRASVDIAKPIDAVFDHCTRGESIVETFRGYGPIPALVRVTFDDGSTLREGAVRRVESADGSVLRERVLRFEPPHVHAYTLENIAKPLSLIVRQGEAEWTFATRGAGTHVSWRYRFELTTPLVLPLGGPLLHVFMRGAMQRCLDRLRARLEAA